jgi:hypothetical protein
VAGLDSSDSSITRIFILASWIGLHHTPGHLLLEATDTLQARVMQLK